jgi:hypothetical protein
MSEFLIIAIVAVSAVVGVSGVLTYLLLGTMRAGREALSHKERARANGRRFAGQ